jgi:hypothetical protein
MQAKELDNSRAVPPASDLRLAADALSETLRMVRAVTRIFPRVLPMFDAEIALNTERLERVALWLRDLAGP